MIETLYRRPLPTESIAFSSPDGRKVFAEALSAGGLDGYFQLAEHPTLSGELSNVRAQLGALWTYASATECP